MNKQQLAKEIWDSANKMRSKIDASEYKDYILGFIFYKYLSDSEEKKLREWEYDDDTIQSVTEEDSEAVKALQKEIGYFISYENLFSTWCKMGSDFTEANVVDALNAFSRLIGDTHKKVFENIFNTLQTGLSKLGDSSGSRTKVINKLIKHIKKIPTDGKQDYDVLGFVYEYLISQFAANAGKKAGEFYTPYEASVIMSEIIAHHLKDRKEIRIYDPTSGSGSLLINIGHSVSQNLQNPNAIKYYAQELKDNTYNLTRMNLIMRGILPSNIVARCGDTLEDDWPYFDESDKVKTYDPLFVDAVVSNPPYSQSWTPGDRENDPRFKEYGLAPKTKADYAFLLHAFYHTNPGGIMTIVLPHGVLFRGDPEKGKGEGFIRKNLVEQNNNSIDAIIGLPANMFYGTGIPTIIMVLKKQSDYSDTLIIDASKHFVKDGKKNKLRASDIKRIVDTVINRTEIPGFSKRVSREEIRANGYNLNIPRYVDSSEKGETWDIYASMFGGIPKSEIEEYSKYWDAFPTLKSDLFTESDTPFVSLKSDDTKSVIKSNADVISYIDTFKRTFAGFDRYLIEKLVYGYRSVNTVSAKKEICEEIFRRIADISLIDKYDAYQLLDDSWAQISTDIEILSTETFDAVRKVDPNMVPVKNSKKKSADDDEEKMEQKGWQGHVLPFDLVQRCLLTEQTAALAKMQAELEAITSEYTEIIESMSEDEKEECKEQLNEDCTAFEVKQLNRKIKDLKSDTDSDNDELIEKLEKALTLSKTEKTLKKAISSANAALELAAKTAIENISDDEARKLLEIKWFERLLSNINAMPVTVVDELAKSIAALGNKYSITYHDIETDIDSTETILCDMLQQLTGNEFDMKGIAEFKKLLSGGEG